MTLKSDIRELQVMIYKSMITKLEEATHYEFKIKCLQNHSSMNKVIKLMVEHYIKTGEIGLTKEIVEVEKIMPKKTCIMLDGSKVTLPVEPINRARSLYESDGIFLFSCNGSYYEITDTDKRRLVSMSDYPQRLAKKMSETNIISK